MHSETMLPLAGLLLAVGLMLTAVSLLPDLARRMSVPLTVLLAIVGVGLGLILHGTDMSAMPEQVQAMAGALLALPENADIFIYLFLPVLLFEAALNLDLRALLRDWAPVLLLAIVAVLLCTLFVGLALSSLAPEQPLLVCLILGCVVATTDPIAVISLFRDLGAPERLRLLVEGESLLNDAAAIALFTVFLTLLDSTDPGAEPGGNAVTHGIVLFTVGFGGGLVVGAILGRLACMLLRLVRRQPLSEIALTLAVPYVTFVVANDMFHVSGVVAVVAAGLAVGTLGRSSFSARSWQQLQTVWSQLAFLASTLIFLLAATVIPPLLADVLAGWHLVLLVGALVLATLASRAATLYLLLPALSLARLSAPVSGSQRLAMLWGGLRGAVSIALAVAVTVRPELTPEQKSFIAGLSVLYVLESLAIHGLTLKPLMRLLRLDRLPPAEQAMRDRALALDMTAVQRQLEDMASANGWDTPVPAPPPPPPGEEPAEALTPDRLRAAALLAVTAREQRLVRSYRESGLLSVPAVHRLARQAAHLEEAAHRGEAEAYTAAAAEALQFTRGFRLASALQRRFGLSGPLEEALYGRAVLLVFTEVMCRDLQGFATGRLADVFGRGVAAELDEMLAQRLATATQSLAALRLLYPQFLHELETRILHRARLRLEEATLDRLMEEGLVSQEIHNRLHDALVQRQRRLDGRLQIHLGLALEGMLQGVPMLSRLTRPQLAQLARVLRPHFVMPGEEIVRTGEPGHDMYFVTVGQVAVIDGGGAKLALLGSGEFFGEVALLEDRPRTATVRAKGYCHLLQLRRRDFQRLMAGSETFRDAIQGAARDRTAGPEATA